MEKWTCDCGAEGKHQFAWDGVSDVEYFCDACWEKFLDREEQAAKWAEEYRIEAERTYHANMD